MTDSDELSAPIRTLHALLAETLEPDALAWLSGCMAEIAATSHKLGPLGVHHAAALTRLDSLPLGPPAESINTGCGFLDAAHWTRADAGRACLVAAAVGPEGPADMQTLLPLFREGRHDERISLMRMLCTLPDGEALLPLAHEASRVDDLQVYEALALDNPYPAAWYDEHAFNRMVVECLRDGLPLERVIGLMRRANPELTELCLDYREERTQAGRRVPADIWLALVPHAGPKAMDLALAELDCEDAERRWYATRALVAHTADFKVLDSLRARRKHESDPRILELLGTI
jgi:hypothetical protein